MYCTCQHTINAKLFQGYYTLQEPSHMELGIPERSFSDDEESRHSSLRGEEGFVSDTLETKTWRVFYSQGEG